MKNLFSKLFTMIVATIAVALGANGNVLMAAGTLSPDANGSEAQSASSTNPAPVNTATDGGVASVTNGQQIAPDLYETDLEETIAKLDPMSTAFLTIASQAQSRQINAQEYEFYSIGPRVIHTTCSAWTNGTDRALLTVADSGCFTKDDTIRVVGVKGQKSDGTATAEDLMLIVIDIDSTTGKVAAYAKNGVTGGFTLPTFPSGATSVHLVRMGKSCAESAAQTGRAYQLPTSQKGCVQNFMLQIEQTEFDRLTEKRVSWDFDDIVDWQMRDYKVVKENTYLWGVGGKDRHNAHDLENNYTMQGIWWQANNDISLGTAASGGASFSEITGADLVEFCKAAFIGNGGSQEKYLFAGANMIEAFDKIKAEQFSTKDIVTENDLTIQKFKTSFGTINLVYDKQFDICGMANAGFLLDKAYLRKVDFITLKRTELKLKESGQRNSNGVVLQEVNAIYLQYANAHARVWLAGAENKMDFTTAALYDRDSSVTRS